MHIAQVAPLAESVPPELYGGTERVIAWLVDELVELGHRVTLIASADSKTRAELIPAWPHALRLGRPPADPIAAQTMLLELVAQHARGFDIVRSHIDWLHLPLLTRLRAPSVTTLHGRLDAPGLTDVLRLFPDAPLVSISNSQRELLPAAHWLATIYHGMPKSMQQPSSTPGQYLAFLGRLAPEKWPEAAFRIAKTCGIPLRIAAKIPQAERTYFAQVIAPQVDGSQIRLVGEVNDSAKQEFLANASALLFPINWPEPFGLVMIEAMACGTPVIAFRHGSVPEIVEDGVTGYVVDTETEAAAAVKRFHRSTVIGYKSHLSAALRQSEWRRSMFVFMRRCSAAQGAAVVRRPLNTIAGWEVAFSVAYIEKVGTLPW